MAGRPAGRIVLCRTTIHEEYFMRSFQLSGIDHCLFEHLFELDDEQLADLNIVRRIADASPGFPCRVCLEDADPGAEVLLLNYTHHEVDSPYRSSGPVYVRRGACRRVLPPGEVPAYVTRRVISLRAYDGAGMMVGAEVVPGPEVAAAIDRMLATGAAAYVHLHNAPQGCFSCRVDCLSVGAGPGRVNRP
jgi:hypothetical protein